MKALYSLRGNRELGDLVWEPLGGTPGVRGAFAKFLAALDPNVFGAVSGTVRVATRTPGGPIVETWPLAELDQRWTQDHYLIDGKLDLEPTVIVQDGEIELVELTQLAQEEWPMDMVPLIARGERWAIVGHPAEAEDESLLFMDVGFDGYGDHDALTVWFRTKTDLWLAYGLDGEPTGPDHRANRELLISALKDLAARTGARLTLDELARSPGADSPR